MTAWGCVSEAAGVLACAGMHGEQTGVLGLVGSQRTGRAVVQRQLLGHPLLSSRSCIQRCRAESPARGDPWQGPGAFRERVQFSNCSNLGLLSCCLWSGHISVKLHLL